MATKPNDNVRPFIYNPRATMIAAVKELQQYDHGFLTAEGVDKITAPFGATGWSYPHKANPKDPKGLTFHDGSKVKTGMAAHEIAERLCRHLGVEYVDAFGRGTQLRNCCRALLDMLNRDPVTTETK
jgi:hypothetical protein